MNPIGPFIKTVSTDTREGAYLSGKKGVTAKKEEYAAFGEVEKDSRFFVKRMEVPKDENKIMAFFRSLLWVKVTDPSGKQEYLNIGSLRDRLLFKDRDAVKQMAKEKDFAEKLAKRAELLHLTDWLVDGSTDVERQRVVEGFADHKRNEEALPQLRTAKKIEEAIPGYIIGAERKEIAKELVVNAYDEKTGDISGNVTVENRRELLVERRGKSPMAIYSIHQVIGTGGFGAVKQVKNLATGTFAALKHGRNVHQEAENLQTLKDMGIKGVQPAPYLVTSIKVKGAKGEETHEAMVGELYTLRGLRAGEFPDLHTILNQRPATSRQHCAAQVLGQYRQFRGKVHHGDIKPPNFFADDKAGRDKICLGDWAGMKRLDKPLPKLESDYSNYVFTPAYTPPSAVRALASDNPEQRKVGAMFLDRFGIGATLFETLVQSRPFLENGYQRNGFPKDDQWDWFDYRAAQAVVGKDTPLMHYLKAMCSLTCPTTEKEFLEQEKLLDGLLDEVVASGALPAIPTYA